MKWLSRGQRTHHAAAAAAMAWALGGALTHTFGQPAEGDLMADTWVGVDALGRVLPGADVCGPPRPGKRVAMFYWTWHIRTTGGARGPYDNMRITRRALAEGKPAAWPQARANHHWGEPELGYYLSTDPFVIRRHASLLVDAGVDVVVFDTTNPPWTWKDAHEALCREYTAMRREGNRTPDIAFMCPFGDPTAVVDRLMDELYGPRHFEHLWFRWRGKPLLLANPGRLGGRTTARELFTFRAPIPGYWTRPSGPGQWPWLQVHPQHAFPNEEGGVEIVAVGVAQNAIPGAFGPAPMSHRQGAMGRSWHGGARDPDPDAIRFGPNFREQWDRAIALDPEVVFVTGWNEWTAIRLPTFGPYNEIDHPYHRRGLFIDQYNQEYSRDCEPMQGGHGDDYYYQLMANVRRFKGVRDRPEPSGPRRITIDAGFEDWNPVQPEYRDTVGDTLHRDHPGYGDTHYVNDTGRNDIVLAKAAYDDAAVSFFVETRQALTPSTDRNWMLLFIDADRDPTSGWHGYDLLIKPGEGRDPQSAAVLRLARDRAWTRLADVPAQASANRLELAIPRDVFGQSGTAAPSLDFHWADNIQRLAIEAFGTQGDSAPNRRCNYRFGTAPEANPGLLAFFGERPDPEALAGLPPDDLLDLGGAAWIWHPDTPEATEAAPIETVRFRCEVTVLDETDPERPWFLVAAVDNNAEVFVDGELAGTVSGWTPPPTIPLALGRGRHTLQVRVANLGDEPNPAGLAMQVGRRGADGQTVVLSRTGDGSWEASRDGNDWQTAHRLCNVGAGPWGPLR